MDMKKYDIAFVHMPFGFVNLGATCYFNALLQSIISCPAFEKVLIANRDVDEYKKNPVVQTMLTMYDMLAQNSVGGDNEQNLKNIAPMVWKSVFDKAMTRKDNVKFTPGQECVREGFHLFLESLDGLDEIQNLFLHRYQTLIFCQDCDDWVVDKECEYTMFEVQSNLTSPQLPRFRNIDPNYEKVRPLDQFLMKQNNYVDKFHKCPKCGKLDERFQTTRLIMIPEILVVLSKKYDMGGRCKSYDVTDFPEVMRFNGKDDDGKSVPMVYQAVSRIEHIGSMSGGHYNCHALRNDKKWYLLDDSIVSEGLFKSTSNTYMVFYHLQ